MTSNLAQADDGAESGSGASSDAQPDSLNNHGKNETNLDKRLDGASSQADILKIIEDAKHGRLPGAETSPAAKASGDTNGAPADKVEGDTATTEAETSGETTAEGETPAAPDAAGGEGGAETGETAAEADGAKPPAADEAKPDEDDHLPERIRLTNFSKVEKLALSLKREDPALSLAEAEARAKKALGIEDKPKADEPAADGKPADDGQPKTVAEVDAKLKELVALRTKASTQDLDFAKTDELTLQIEALRDRKIELREAEKQAASAEQQAYDAAFDAAERQAAAMYAFVKDANSAGFKRMAEVDAALKASNDPLFDAPDKALKIAQMVARELNIAPKSPTAAKAAVGVRTAAVPAKPGAKPGLPPVVSGGASRTTTASTQGGNLSKEIESLKSPQQLEEFLRKVASGG